MAVIGYTCMVVCGLATLTYLVFLQLHELDRYDLRQHPIFRMEDTPGLKRDARVKRLNVLIAITAVSLILLPLQLMVNSPISFAVFSVLECLYARSDATKHRLTEALGRLPLGFVHAIIVLVAVGLSIATIEATGNAELYRMVVKPVSFVMNVVITGIFTLCMWFLFQRKGKALVLSASLFYILGIIEYFCVLFKEMPLLPSDILALKTAASIAFEYTFAISGQVLLGYAIVVGLAWLVSCTTWNKQKWYIVPVNLLLAFACAGSLVYGFVTIDLADDLGIIVKAWRPLEEYDANGFLPSFLTSVQGVMTSEPEGYTPEKTDDMISAYADMYDQTSGSSTRRTKATTQFRRQNPNVIIVMNETFSDLSIFNELGCGYTGPEYFNSVDAVMRGTLYVSAYGGGTCNSEFELFTGISMNYFGQGMYPYTLYNFEGVETLVDTFSELGYDTTAIHPNIATNWNRSTVYEAMGFNTFLTLDDFEDAERIRSFVSDAATYDTCLDIIDASDNPQFIFLVTMQNHSGYKTGELDEETLTDYEPEVLGSIKTAELNEYLTLIEESDEALEYLLEALEESDEPTVVLFFGDHQPYLTTQLNNELMEDENELEHSMRLWQTSYLIWANYDIAGAEDLDPDQDISTNYLGAIFLDAIGAPLTTYQRATITLHEYIPAINVIGYEGVNGYFYAGEEEDPYVSIYRKFRWIWYRRFFDIERQGSLYIFSSEPGITDPEGDAERITA